MACAVNLLIKYVLLKALSPVCMKYTAQDESLMANMVQSQVLYLSQDSHQELYTFIQTNWQCFKVFYCILHLLKCQKNTVPWSF